MATTDPEIITPEMTGEINDAVARFVMGWHLTNISYKTPPDPNLDQWLDVSNHLCEWHVNYEPTVNLRQAWDAVTHLTQTSFRLVLSIEVHRKTVYASLTDPVTQEKFGAQSHVQALPLLLCTIALKAINHLSDSISDPSKGQQ